MVAFLVVHSESDQFNDGLQVRQLRHLDVIAFPRFHECPRDTVTLRALKVPEDEYNRLKEIVADLTLGMEMLQDVIRRKL